nr:acetylxylan esterase [Verrucomicrobiota bacterium]
MNSTPSSFAAATVALLTGFTFAATAAPAPRPGVNYDEAKAGAYTLPDPLTAADGKKVTTAKGWEEQRRPEILKLFQTHVYGRSPGKPDGMKFEVSGIDERALGGKARRKEVKVYFTGKTDGPQMTVLIYVPNEASKPAPAFLGLNFGGNHAVNADPGITLSRRWTRDNKEKGVVNNRATEASRGTEASRWQVEKVISRGYALATIYYGDLEPDFAEGWKQGIRAALSKDGSNTVFAPDDWGAIGAWAWGLSRALD